MKSDRRSLVSVTSVLPILLAGLVSQGAEPGTRQTGLESYRRARAVVERAAERTGTLETVRAAGGISVRMHGVMNRGAEAQGSGGLDPGPFSEWFAWDPGEGRFAHESDHRRSDGTVAHVREVFESDTERLIVVLHDGFAVRLRGEQEVPGRAALLRRLPQALLSGALGAGAALRHGGVVDGDELVHWALPDGALLELRFDGGSGLLEAVSYLLDVPGFGDSEVTWRLDGYRAVETVGLFPRRSTAILAGRPLFELAVEDVATGASAVSEAFSVPPGIEPPGEPIPVGGGSDPSAGAEVREVAAGVWIVTSLRGGFHPLFVDLGDSLLAVDAPAGYPELDRIPAVDVAPGPTSDWLSRRFLELIRATVPDKPVERLVVTHFHNDHAGGLRAFVATGARILAPPSAAAPIRRLVEAPHTIAPDPLAIDPEPLRLRVVDEPLSMRRPGGTLEILPVGPDPHSEGMLVVHLPEERVLYVADLLTAAPVERFPTSSHEALDRFFVRWLDDRGLAPDRIYTSHGSGLVTSRHLEKLRSSVTR